MYDNFAALLQVAEETKRPLHEIIVDEEIFATGRTREEIFNRMRTAITVMRRSLEEGRTLRIDLPIKEVIEQSELMLTPPVFLGADLKMAVANAMAIMEYSNGMGIICAAPTAGSCGVFPATLFQAQQMLHRNNAEVENAWLVGGAAGTIIGNNATLSGSEGGCQAEVGVAAAMAAAALTYLAHGTPQQVGQAVALALKNLLGLICDPVAGLVIVPCIKRNAIGVMNAFLAAEMALSGVTSLIPVDEVVDTLMKVGNKIPFELKETSLGGLARTPTGKRLKREIFGDKPPEGG